MFHEHRFDWVGYGLLIGEVCVNRNRSLVLPYHTRFFILADLLQMGFGKWMVELMQGYFVTGAAFSEQEALPGNRAGNGV